MQSPDGEDGHGRVIESVEDIPSVHQLVVTLGGDNSITYSVASGLWPDLSKTGNITLDAQHDPRDGSSNDSPIWQLIQAGLLGKDIVQIGTADFANSVKYSARANESCRTGKAIKINVD